jgi:magnesium-protoporphyrin IX monomethyl ester (oxidative) cyclase
MMRANPSLLKGRNVYWMRFFQLAVFATMYVRDHTRPEMHKALGLDPSAYGLRVFEITSEISKQVFPVTLRWDLPEFRAGLDRLCLLQERVDAAKARGGLTYLLTKGWCSAQSALVFARLFFLPVHREELPRQIRMVPSW